MSDISLPGRPLIEKIDKICGICLWEKANLKPLCDVALIEVVEDGLPHYICAQCLLQYNSAYKLKQQRENFKRFLQNFLLSNINIKGDNQFSELDSTIKTEIIPELRTISLDVLRPLWKEECETVELHKKFRGILNKLTPLKCDTLLVQVKLLKINTSEHIQGFIDLVFKKAVDEPMFSITYAIVCRELALLDVRLADTSSKNPEFVSFRKLLVIRCRTEFETLSVNDNERTLKLKEIEECTLADQKKNMQLKLKDYDRKVRMRSLGIVRFIGELFKQQMLTANLMIRCLSNFLTYDHEISVECLCTLLRTVGKELESKSVYLDQIFKAMREIVDEKHEKVSRRVRFMLQDVIDLRCSNWISGRQSEEDHTRVELYIKLRAILNRLTPQNYEMSLLRIRSLKITTVEHLQDFVDLVFEKVIDEPNFSAGYAFICKDLAMLRVPVSNNDPEHPKFMNFGNLLITRCQAQFEKQSVDKSERALKVMEIEKCTDPKKKEDIQYELETYDRMIRVKNVANIRFIGELFKQKMLTVNIIIICLSNLLKNKDEESLECLSTLLTTVGKELESKSVYLDQIFKAMREIVDEKHEKVSRRVRFMLQNLIDLRSSRWVPRRQELNPKTLYNIEKEASDEEFDQEVRGCVIL